MLEKYNWDNKERTENVTGIITRGQKMRLYIYIYIRSTIK
jgi:hypothetical protein